MLTVVGLLYTIPSFALFALLTLFGVPYLSELNLVIALTIYAVAIMTRSVTEGLASVDPVTRSAAVAVGFGAVATVLDRRLPALRAPSCSRVCG